MNNVLVAIERSKFNYLYKYDRCFTSRRSIIDMSFRDLSKSASQNPGLAAEKIERALPLFEREDEVLLMEVDSTLIDYQLGFEFCAIQRIIPLNELASDLFQTKLNANFIIEDPLSNDLFERVRILREKGLRTKLSTDFLKILNVDLPPESNTERIFEAVNRKISKSAGFKTTTLDAILDLDTTPSGIPSGNIEGLMKIICVGLLKVTGHTNQLRKSPLFQLLLDNQSELNSHSIQRSYDFFDGLIKKNEHLVSKLRDTLKTNEFEGDVFKICYYFYVAKKILLASEGDIKALLIEIDRDNISKIEFGQAMYLLGLTLSYHILHESIQQLKFAPLFGIRKPLEQVAYYSAGDSIELDPKVDEPAKNHLSEDSTEQSNIENEIDQTPEASYSPESKKNNNSKSERGTLFEQNNENPRLVLITKVQETIKGQGSKVAKELLKDLFQSNNEFSFVDLENKVLQEESLLKKDRTPKKVAQEMLDVFNEL